MVLAVNRVLALPSIGMALPVKHVQLEVLVVVVVLLAVVMDLVLIVLLVIVFVQVIHPSLAL